MCLYSALRTELLNYEHLISEHNFQPMNYWLSASYTAEPLFQFIMLLVFPADCLKIFNQFSLLFSENHPWNNFYIQTVGKDEKYKENPTSIPRNLFTNNVLFKKTSVVHFSPSITW